MTLGILFEMVPKEFFNRIVRIADGDRDGVRRAADDTLPPVRRIAMKFRNSAIPDAGGHLKILSAYSAAVSASNYFE